MQKIRKGDDVIVIAGKDKGKRGTVGRVLRDQDRVVVDGVNLIKRHVRGNPQRGEPGGIQTKEASLHISNVALYNAKAGKADRVAIREVDGKRVRYFKSTNEPVDV